MDWVGIAGNLYKCLYIVFGKAALLCKTACCSYTRRRHVPTTLCQCRSHVIALRMIFKFLPGCVGMLKQIGEGAALSCIDEIKWDTIQGRFWLHWDIFVDVSELDGIRLIA